MCEGQSRWVTLVALTEMANTTIRKFVVHAVRLIRSDDMIRNVLNAYGGNVLTY